MKILGSAALGKKNSRWIIVSNRLPVSYNEEKKELTASMGGLVTAIRAIKSRAQRVWVGVAPDGVDERSWKKLKGSWKGAEELEPIFVGQSQFESYYNGFCNDLLWPILHYESERAGFSEDNWNSYVKVNQLFADRIVKMAKEGDIVWVHDFHLFLLPQLIKKKRKDLKVGFFLHVPFPSSEIFRQLPRRSEILEGVMASDLIGFHDYSYLRHFCSSLLTVLGIDSSFLSAKHKGHRAKLGVFPVSIDTHKIVQKAQSATVINQIKKMPSQRFQFLGVDRLDYTKGIELKLKAYRKFLELYPQLRGKVKLVQLAVPTRTGVPEYIELKETVEQLVGEINGAFATTTWTPVRYIYSSVGQNELLALYRKSQALIVCSKRDGMNLVALEYIASQRTSSPGVLMLSEFAGAMSMLSQTLPINPWNVEQTAERMKQAYDMPVEERVNRWKPMSKYLKEYTATDWARSFIEDLKSVEHMNIEQAESFSPTVRSVKGLLKRAKEFGAERLTLMLDYDGTLVPIEDSPEKAVLPATTLRLLKKLHLKGVEVVIVSGRRRDFLKSQFEDMPFVIACEHGARVYVPQKGTWRNKVHGSSKRWYPTALKVMQDYAVRVENSFVEKKTHAVAWHYRKSPVEYGVYQAKKLKEQLEMALINQPVNVLSGKKVIEVKAHEANKGFFATSHMELWGENCYVLAFGDDATDEDLFEALKGRGFSFKVEGPIENAEATSATKADYLLSSQDKVIDFLKLLNEELS